MEKHQVTTEVNSVFSFPILCYSRTLESGASFLLAFSCHEGASCLIYAVLLPWSVCYWVLQNCELCSFPGVVATGNNTSTLLQPSQQVFKDTEYPHLHRLFPGLENWRTLWLNVKSLDQHRASLCMSFWEIRRWSNFLALKKYSLFAGVFERHFFSSVKSPILENYIILEVIISPRCWWVLPNAHYLTFRTLAWHWCHTTPGLLSLQYVSCSSLLLKKYFLIFLVFGFYFVERF